MARLSASERSRLPDRAFAYVDAHGVRRLPIHDEAHVRNALARFRQVRFEDDAARDRARERLLRAARRYRIVPVGFIAGELGAAPRPPGRDLPSGFVTMLMTDLEGSTEMVQRLGPRFAVLVDDMWSWLREAVGAHGGHEVEARADEFFAAFAAPRAAVDAAIEIQRSMRARRFDGVDVRVRAGVHSGYPTSTASNYVGLDVNVTSRITALGHGGQILASANTREAVRATDPRGIRFVALGDHRLRGLAHPVALYQVGAKGLATRFPPLRH